MSKQFHFRDFLLGVITYEVITVVLKTFGLDNIWIKTAVIVGITVLGYIVLNIIKKKKRGA